MRKQAEWLMWGVCVTLTIAFPYRSAEASLARKAPWSSFSPDTLPVYQEFQVDEPVRILRWDKPTYPDSLKRAKIEGSVLIHFVVDTSGQIEQRGVRFLRASGPGFAAAVRAVLESGQFAPATLGGKPVRQLVQQQFLFKP